MLSLLHIMRSNAFPSSSNMQIGRDLGIPMLEVVPGLGIKTNLAILQAKGKTPSRKHLLQYNVREFIKQKIKGLGG